MREIKFRMFDTEEKEFMSGCRIIESRINDLNKKGRFIFQQWTGLKDKNDKEIYEGDIIKREFEIGHVVIDPVTLGAEGYEIENSGYFIGVVSYRPSEGYVLNKCKKFNDDDEILSKKSGVKIYANYAEIIGNIYTNPELLGVKA